MKAVQVGEPGHAVVADVGEPKLTLRFSIGDPLADRERLMQMILSRGLAPERVITHRLPLAEAAEAYRLFDTRAATKVVLLP